MQPPKREFKPLLPPALTGAVVGICRFLGGALIGVVIALLITRFYSGRVHGPPKPWEWSIALPMGGVVGLLALILGKRFFDAIRTFYRR
jgi:hypothetical protein